MMHEKQWPHYRMALPVIALNFLLIVILGKEYQVCILQLSLEKWNALELLFSFLL